MVFAKSMLVDTNLVKLDDGCICSIEGWWHPDDKFIANYIYVPSSTGEHIIDSIKYDKIIRQPNGRWRNFADQVEYLKEVYDIESNNALFIDNKALLCKERVVEYYDPKETLIKFMELFPQKWDVVKCFLKTIGIDSYEDISMIGSFQLGLFNKKSDIDIMISKSVIENELIFNRIYNLAPNKKRPLRIEYKNELLCFQFGYKKYDNTIFSTQYVMKEKVDDIFVITDISHSLYNPCVLEVVSETTKDILKVVIYNGAQRGNFQINDKIHVEGKKVSFDTEEVIVASLCELLTEWDHVWLKDIGYSYHPMRVEIANYKIEMMSCLLGKTSYSNILEVGCGDGLVLVEAMKEFSATNGYGCDISTFGLRKAISNIKDLDYDLDFKKGFAHRLPYDSDIFSMCFSLGVIEHYADLGKVQMSVDEMYRVLDDDGEGIVMVPNKYSFGRIDRIQKQLGNNRKYGHQYEFTPNELMNMFRISGFKEVDYKVFPMKLLGPNFKTDYVRINTIDEVLDEFFGDFGFYLFVKGKKYNEKSFK